MAYSRVLASTGQTKEQIREAIQNADPTLLAWLDTMRARFGGKLVKLEFHVEHPEAAFVRDGK